MKIFARCADRFALALGTAAGFLTACALISGWAFIYWRSGWKDSVNLAGNVCISVFTLLALFVLQYTQRNNDKATHLKLDELLRSVAEARNEFVGAEKRDEKSLDELNRKIEDVTETCNE